MFFVRDKSNIIIFGISESLVSEVPSEAFDYIISPPDEQSSPYLSVTNMKNRKLNLK